MRATLGWSGIAPLLHLSSSTGVSCLTCASPTCYKSFGFYPAWQDLDRCSLDGGSTKPLSPGHRRALWKITYWKFITNHNHRWLFPLSTFPVYFVAFWIPDCPQGIWRGRLEESSEVPVGRGGTGRTTWPRMVMALGICPEQENKETANNDQEGLTGTCFTLWHATSSF